MIYLIEDKTSRRNDYGWTDENIMSMSDAITVVADATKLKELSSQILTAGSVILFHESFAQRENYEKQNDVYSFLSNLQKTDNIYVAYFSGSTSQRKIEDNICSLHVQTLYSNLDVFIEHYKKGVVDFCYLLYGEDPQIEERLLRLIREVNQKNIDAIPVNCDKNILVFRTAEDAIQFPVLNAVLRNGCDYDCDDTAFVELVKEQSGCQYDAIYIPLSMGETLSDFLGLRLAMFFRLCNSINKYAHLFIYGVVNSTLFAKYECAEIIKMYGVNYISAEANTLKKSLQHISRIDEDKYRLGIKSIHLNVPTNIGDNHSVANKWGIYRWSLALEHSDRDIENRIQEIESSLYFKYLTALYPPTQAPAIKPKELEIEIDKQALDAKIPGLNVLYVDDEADEGWYELLCYILYDVNNINFDHIGRDIKSKSEEEVIAYVMSRIKSSDVNLVILDLRLHQNDFNNTAISEITGYKLLNEIKDHNRGIQVLMFSATNKIWNLQALQKSEVDGFIIKEAPENSIDRYFTRNSILQLIENLSNCTKNAYRKELWDKLQIEKEHIAKLRRKKRISLEYEKAVTVLLKMTEDALFSKDLKYAYATAFMNLFRIIEATANEWIDKEPVIEINENGEVCSYFVFRKDGSQLLKFNSKEFKANPSEKLFFTRENPNLPYFQKICNTLHVLDSYNHDAYDIVAKRNNFTHIDLIENNEIEIFTVRDVLSIFNLVDQIIMNQAFNDKESSE